MAIEVELPDGRMLEFPDTMEQADIATAIQTNFPEFAPKKTPEPAMQQPEPAMQQPEPALPQGDFYADVVDPGMDDELLQKQELEGMPKKGLFKRIKQAFTGEGRKTAETETLPEFMSRGAKKRKTIFGTEAPETLTQRIVDTITQTGDPAANAKTTAGMLATFNPEKQKEIIKANIPEAEFETDEQGNTIINIGGQRSILNKPGFSETDAAQAITTTLSFLPAAKLAQVGKGLMAQSLIGGVAAGTTEAGLGQVAKAAGAKEGASKTEIGVAAGIEALMPPALKIAKRVGRGIFQMSDDALRQVPGMTPEIEQNIKQARQAQAGLKEATGVDVPVFPGQQTLSPAQLIEQRIVSQLSEGSQIGYKRLSEQNTALRKATDSLIEQITDVSTLTSPGKFKKAADLALEARKQARRQATKGLYKEALEAGGTADLTDVKKYIASELKDTAPGMDVRKALDKVNKYLKGDPNLRALQNAKVDIDNVISKIGPGSVGNNTKRMLVNIKERLVNAMTDASPLYKDANDKFKAMSPAINEYEQSFLGKIAKLDPLDPRIQDISKNVFKGTAGEIKQMKKIIDEVDPEAFNAVLKSEMLNSVDESINVFQTPDAIENIPQKIGKVLFGKNKRKNAMLAAMNPEQQKNFRYLQDVLKRAGTGRAPGSPTASFQEAIKKKTETWSMLIRDWMFNPLQKLQKTGDASLVDKRIRAMAEFAFDPKWATEVSKIRQSPKNAPSTIKAMAQLLNDIELSIKPQKQAAKEPLKAVAQVDQGGRND